MTTVQQAADKAFPDKTYDYALPQAFFDSCLNNGFDVRGQCVWVYDNIHLARKDIKTQQRIILHIIR